MKNIYFSFLLSVSIIPLCHGQTGNFITYNIKNDYQKDGDDNWNSRKEKMIEMFRHYQLEMIGIQEALHNQVEYIDDSLSEYNYIGVGRDDGKDEGEYCAIFYNKYNYKLIRNSTFWLSETPYEISVGWDAALPRICTYGLFEHIKSGKRIWVLNTHFDHIGQQAREKSAKLILEQLEKLNDKNLPVILMGDLNLTPEEKAIALINNHLDDGASISLHEFYGPPGTFNGFDDRRIDRRIDYFFTSGIQVIKYIHIDDRLDNNKHISDHLPVMIKCEF